VRIRAESERDRTSIHAVNTAAFDTPAEADLVDSLRGSADPIISLVAEADGKVVGHILFTPVTLTDCSEAFLMGLAPMAVAPTQQGQGIGSLLVKAGLDECKKTGAEAVVVLGHPGYYPRFGFAPASRFGIKSEYDVPDDVFMVIEMQPGSLSGKAGTVKYHGAFGDV